MAGAGRDPGAGWGAGARPLPPLRPQPAATRGLPVPAAGPGRALGGSCRLLPPGTAEGGPGGAAGAGGSGSGARRPLGGAAAKGQGPAPGRRCRPRGAEA